MTKDKLTLQVSL